MSDEFADIQSRLELVAWVDRPRLLIKFGDLYLSQFISEVPGGSTAEGSAAELAMHAYWDALDLLLPSETANVLNSERDFRFRISSLADPGCIVKDESLMALTGFRDSRRSSDRIRVIASFVLGGALISNAVLKAALGGSLKELRADLRNAANIFKGLSVSFSASSEQRELASGLLDAAQAFDQRFSVLTPDSLTPNPLAYRDAPVWPSRRPWRVRNLASMRRQDAQTGSGRPSPSGGVVFSLRAASDSNGRSKGLDGSEEREESTLPEVSVYLDTMSLAQVKRVETALAALFASAGLELDLTFGPVISSWWARFKIRSMQVASSEPVATRLEKIERALEATYIDKPLASVNLDQSTAVANLLKSLEGIDNAVLSVGSVILVKTKAPNGPASVYVKTLTASELRTFEANQHLMSNPQAALAHLHLLAATPPTGQEGPSLPQLIPGAADPHPRPGPTA